MVHIARNLIAVLLVLCLCWTAPAGAKLIQHLDATVEGSVVTDGAGVVTEWIDQSGSGNNALAGVGSVLYPSTIAYPSGLAGLDFGLERNSLELFSIGVSWGGHESLIYAPAISYLKELDHEQFEGMGISLGDMRISVGLEHVDDLIKDLDRALNQIRN